VDKKLENPFSGKALPRPALPNRKAAVSNRTESTLTGFYQQLKTGLIPSINSSSAVRNITNL
jgi:hypothetical protein